MKAGSTSVVNQLASTWIGAAVTSLATRFKQQKIQTSEAAGATSSGTGGNDAGTAKSSDLSPQNDVGGGDDDFSFSSRTPSPTRSTGNFGSSGMSAPSGGASSKQQPMGSHITAGSKASSSVLSTGVNRSLLVPTPASSAAGSAKVTTKQHSKKTSALESAKTSWENDLWLSLDGTSASAQAADSPSPTSELRSVGLAASSKTTVPPSSASTQSFQGWDEESSDFGSATGTPKPFTGSTTGGNSWAAWNDASAAGTDKLVGTAVKPASNLLQPVSITPGVKAANNNSIAGVMMPTISKPPPPAPTAGGGWNDDFFDKMLTSSGNSGAAGKKSVSTGNVDADWDPFGNTPAGGASNSNNNAQQRRPAGSTGGKPMKLSAKRIG